ncbi:aminopeptidase N [Nocardioides currus]|uniref:aminopeptidase N n=1 Tax=Nocardioides currus TaxID=2133958 RepID=UPI001403B8C0|nr:aminopeptidase N [Nocardioides currus]
MPSLTLAEARERAALISDVAYDIHLDLTSREHAVVTTRVTFACRAPGSSTFLELADATEVVVEGAHGAAYDDGRILLRDLAARNDVTVTARMPYVTTGNGLHTFTDPADGEVYVSAYTGMDIAQRVYACFDQMDLKAPLTVSVTAPSAWTVISNGIATRDGDLWTFTTTPLLPTSMLVVCAGPWVSRTWEHAGLPMGWHARASMERLLDRDLADLRAVTERCLDHYTEAFTEPMPFDSYDQVMAPELNWGAMETAGAVTFRDELLTPGPPSAMDVLWRDNTIAHEMAHMWFGNLVTMTWWEDSWLSESFAEFMGSDVVRRITGARDPDIADTVARTPLGYLADGRRSAHPVAEDAEAMVDVDTAFGNFDMITYAKGGAVLRQLVHWLGHDAFLAGVNRYLTAHAFGNATLADFLAALDAVSDRDVRGWAEQWLRASGFDTIEVTRDGDVPVVRRIGTRAHRLSVAAFSADGEAIAARPLDLADEPVRLDDLAGCAVVPNAGAETFAASSLDPRTWEVVRTRLGTIADPVTRAGLWWTAVAAARRGELAMPDLLTLVADHLPGERHPAVAEGVLELVVDQVVPLLDPAGLDRALDVIARACRGLLAADPDPSIALAAARRLAEVSTDATELAGWLSSGVAPAGVAVDQSLRWRVVTRLVTLGGSPSLVDEELARDASAAGAVAARTARAAVPDAAHKGAAWLTLFGTELSNREFTATSDGFWSAGQHALVAPYLRRYAQQVPALVARRGQAYAEVAGRLAFPRLPLPTADLRVLRDAVAAQVETGRLHPTLARAWVDEVDDLDVALALR